MFPSLEKSLWNYVLYVCGGLGNLRKMLLMFFLEAEASLVGLVLL